MRPTVKTCIILAMLACGCNQTMPAETPTETWQASPYGPTEATRQQRNLNQSGVHDQQIPLETRQRFADNHGIERPTR